MRTNFIYMQLLQINVPTPQVLPQDSVRQIAHEALIRMIDDPSAFWHEILRSALLFGVKVIVAIIIYFVGAWVIRRVRKVMMNRFAHRKTEPTVATFIASAVSITLTVLLVIITIGTLGVDTTSFAALLTAGGMALGMALSGTVQNLAGGIMILVFKPFKVGDWIEAQGIQGKIIEVNITATKVLTGDNRVVILPNGALSNGVIDNYNGRPLRRVEWLVSVQYGSDAEGVRKLIMQLLHADGRILTSQTDTDTLYKEFDISRYQLSMVDYKMNTIPDPEVVLKSLNENDITFRVRAWVRATDYWDAYMALNEQFYSELPKKGYNFAYPHLDVTLIK